MSSSKKENRGGARTGTGPKKRHQTRVIGFRHKKSIIDALYLRYGTAELQQKGKAFLNELYSTAAEAKPKPADLDAE